MIWLQISDSLLPGPQSGELHLPDLRDTPNRNTLSSSSPLINKTYKTDLKLECLVLGWVMLTA